MTQEINHNEILPEIFNSVWYLETMGDLIDYQILYSSQTVYRCLDDNGYDSNKIKEVVEQEKSKLTSYEL